MKKKVIFIVKVNHSIDLITNSSSELFVLEGQTKDIVDSLLKGVHPDYLDEYAEPKNITELTTDELDNFFSYATGSNRWPAQKSDYKIPNGFTFEEVYEPDDKGPAWNGAIQYKVRNNEPGKSWGSFVTEENREWFLDRYNPERNLYFVYSHDENPDYENQEKMWQVAQRYHLG